MPPIDRTASDAELARRRHSIRRDLVRGNTTAIILLIALVGLTSLAVFQSGRADAARQHATEKLWESYRAQARAARLSGEVGRRQQSLQAIAAAAKIRPAPDLRNEAIAALALTDIDATRSYIPHPGTFGISFSPDLAMYALRTDEKIVVQRFDSARPLLSIEPPTPALRARFSPDGRWIAIGYDSGVIEVLEIATGSLIWTGATADADRLQFDFSPDSARFAYYSTAKQVIGIDLAAQKIVFQFDPRESAALLRFSPDDRYIATGGERLSLIYQVDGPSAKLHRELKLPAHFSALAWHRDSREVVIAAEDHLLYVCDIDTGQRQTLQGHTREVVSVSCSPTSDLMVSYAWDGTTRFWNSRTRTELFKTHLGWGASFSNDGKQLAFVRQNAGFGVWDITEPAELKIIGNAARNGTYLRWLDFSPDNQWLALGYFNGVEIWGADSGKLLARIPGNDVKSAAFTKTSDALLVSDVDGSRRWSLERNGDFLNTRRLAPPLLADGRAATAVFSKDRALCAVAGGGQNQSIVVIEMATGRERVLGKQIGSINMDFSADGAFLAVGTWKGTGTRVWNVAEQNIARELDARDASVAFAPGGDWLVTGHSDSYQFWNARTWSNVWSLPRDVPSEATGPMAFSKDGALLAASLNGWTLDLIDVKRRAVAAQLTPPIANTLNTIAFSDDRSRLAAATGGGVALLWDLPKLLARLEQMNLGLPNWTGQPTSEPIVAAPSARWLTSIIIIALGAALLLGMSGLRRHRRLVEEYSSIEQLVLERNAQVESYRAELAHSQKMRALGTLAAGIAHDFNNLLSVIRMANKLTGKEAAGNPDIAANVAVVEEAVGQGKQVVKSMLGYSRASDERSGPYALAELVENAVPLLSKQFLAGISLTLELDYTAPFVTKGRDRLQQVLLNLIVNASEAMNGHGKLTIALKSVTDLNRAFVLKPATGVSYVRLTVQDSGPGIAPEAWPRIFEPFFTTKNMGAEPGTGLGLSLVYTVASEEGFGLAVDNEPRSGAAFHLYVPVTPQDEAAPSPTPEAPGKSTSPTGRVSPSPASRG